MTEGITGLDLVEWQLRVAAGERLPLAQSQIQIREHGHAIEVRICAEDPAKGFVPSAGDLELLKWPEETAGVRVDAGFETGDSVSPLYDSLLGKIIAHAETRAAAIDRLVGALDELRVSGVATNAQWLARALLRPDFRDGNVSTAFIARNADALAVEPNVAALAPFAAAAYAASLAPAGRVRSPWDLADGFRVSMPPAIRVRLRAGEGAPDGAPAGQSKRTLDATVGAQSANSAEVHLAASRNADGAAGAPSAQRLTRLPDAAPLQQWQSTAGGERASVLVSNERITVWQSHAKAIFTLDDGLHLDTASSARAGSLSTPLPGVVVSVAVKEGDKVAAGQTLLVIEAMKMEHAIKAPRAGVVKALKHRVGDRVREGSALAELE